MTEAESDNNFHDHDSFIKKAMENHNVAKSFFNRHLAPEVRDMVNLDSLQLQKESFIAENLKKKVSDILFSADFSQGNSHGSGGKSGYIYMLLEHQSTVDHWMVFRLFNYMMAIWQRHRTEHHKDKHLPLIYPLIFYNGTRKYTAPKDLWSLFKDPEIARSFFCEPVNVINVNEIDDDKFKEYPWAGIIELFMKASQKRDILQQWHLAKEALKELAFATIFEKEDYVRVILWYTANRIEKSEQKDEILRIVNSTLNIEGEEIMASLAQQWKQEGVQRGVQQRNLDIAITMLQKKQDIKLIAEITGLSLQEIKQLHRNLA